jgi:serine/threonine protein kinase/Tfp pilus assembly protein PilF
LGPGRARSEPHIWDEAARPSIVKLTRQYESDWRGARERKPELKHYLEGELGDTMAARLALLRADMGLRFQAGERVRVEDYLTDHPELSSEAVVALAYEEFCLREEAGETPAADEFIERLPEHTEGLRRVFEIHGLVGSGTATVPHEDPGPGSSILPEVGQTIAGFHLVEELGRGTFARVFLAHERQLADRPVALKVARRGSREPQTLARLQHTHIVPIHSYRVDPATELHLLCMPYFGRVTFARLLEDPRMKTARTGAEILAILDELEPDAREAEGAAAIAGRNQFAELPYARAIAWWGARLAEALEHAHERGILHRDIKPSNILVTPFGFPMLLDFNLAQAPIEVGADPPATSLGGTFPYMAPEHLDALADGSPDGVDERADVYGLGVVLFEAMGTRPFPDKPPAGVRTLVDALHQSAALRRQGAPHLRTIHPEVPPALEAVVRKCLSPHPDDRYPTAQALADDLQAVVEDRRLRWASEPIASRAVRWARRRRRQIVFAGTLGLALLSTAYTWHESSIGHERLGSTIREWISEGKREERAGRHDLARQKFATAEQMALGRKGFEALAQSAQTLRVRVDEAGRIHAKADRLLAQAGDLRFALLHFGGNESDVESRLRAVLDPLLVLTLDRWSTLPELGLLDAPKRERLVREVEELLFFWSVSLAASPQSNAQRWSQARLLCQRALDFTRTPAPWQALRDRSSALIEDRRDLPIPTSDPRAEPSAWACLQWGLIHSLLDRGSQLQAIRWLDQAVRLDPRHYWAQYFLAYHYDRAGQPELALSHYNAAIALEPERPWALFARGRLAWKRGDWEHALDDLDLSIDKARAARPETASGDAFPDARLERALVLQRLGYSDAANREYQALIDSQGPHSRLGRKARLNRAWLLVDRGEFPAAWAEYAALEDQSVTSEDRSLINLGRVQLALEWRQPALAEQELSRRLEEQPGNPQWLGLRARARLALDRPQGALEDAQAAYTAERTPSRARWLLRTRLAAGRAAGLRLGDPQALAELPGDRLALRADCRRCLAAIRAESDAASLQTQAVLLAFLGDPNGSRLIDRLVERAPASTETLIARAQIRRYLGRTEAALADVRQALVLDPEDPRLIELAGLVSLDRGKIPTALVAFERAEGRARTHTLFRSRALAHERAGQLTRAARDWTQHLAHDPDDIAGFLGRARVMVRRGLGDHALADLESAGALAQHRPDLLARVALGYLDCLARLDNDLWPRPTDASPSDDPARDPPRGPLIVRRILRLARRMLALATPVAAAFPRTSTARPPG